MVVAVVVVVVVVSDGSKRHLATLLLLLLPSCQDQVRNLPRCSSTLAVEDTFETIPDNDDVGPGAGVFFVSSRRISIRMRLMLLWRTMVPMVHQTRVWVGLNPKRIGDKSGRKIVSIDDDVGEY